MESLPFPAPPTPTLKVKRLNAKAILPTRAYAGDAGWDLYSAVTKNLTRAIHPEEYATGLAVEIPEGFFGFIATRSSFGKVGIQAHPGVIDSGYRGELTVLLVNRGRIAKDIFKGDKIAQLLILPVPNFQLEEVSQLSNSVRGVKGFGSSGR